MLALNIFALIVCGYTAVESVVGGRYGAAMLLSGLAVLQIPFIIMHIEGKL